MLSSSHQPNEPLKAHGFSEALLPAPRDHSSLFPAAASLCCAQSSPSARYSSSLTLARVFLPPLTQHLNPGGGLPLTGRSVLAACQGEEVARVLPRLRSICDATRDFSLLEAVWSKTASSSRWPISLFCAFWPSMAASKDT